MTPVTGLCGTNVGGFPFSHMYSDKSWNEKGIKLIKNEFMNECETKRGIICWCSEDSHQSRNFSSNAQTSNISLVIY